GPDAGARSCRPTHRTRRGCPVRPPGTGAGPGSDARSRPPCAGRHRGRRARRGRCLYSGPGTPTPGGPPRGPPPPSREGCWTRGGPRLRQNVWCREGWPSSNIPCLCGAGRGRTANVSGLLGPLGVADPPCQRDHSPSGRPGETGARLVLSRVPPHCYRSHTTEVKSRVALRPHGHADRGWSRILGQVSGMSSLGKLVAACAAAGVVAAGALFPVSGTAGLASNKMADSLAGTSADLIKGDLPAISTVTDSGGEPIAWLYDQQREIFPSEYISQGMKLAIISIEDRRFGDHNGVDWRGTVRAALTNFTSGDVQQGASTIDQQLVKNYQFLVSAENDAERR